MNTLRVKILTSNRKIPVLNVDGPILSPITITQEVYDRLITSGFDVEILEDKIVVRSDNNKPLFTGEISSKEEVNIIQEKNTTDRVTVEVKNGYNQQKKKKR